MSSEASRLDTIIKQVIRKTGLATRLDARDAIQELRLAAWIFLRKSQKLQEDRLEEVLYESPDDIPPGLLFVILERRATDLLRSPSLSRSGIFQKLTEEPASFSDELASLGPEHQRTPEQCALVHEVLEVLDEELTPRENDVVRRLYLEEQTQDDVAEELDLSRSRIQQIGQEALQKVRNKL